MSCSPEPLPGPEVRVFARQLEECELPPGNARIELEALGDFDASNRTTDSLSTEASGTELTFPPKTLGVRAELSADRSAERFVALGQSRRGDTLPLLLWPETRACALSVQAPGYPAPGGGEGIAYSDELGLVLLAGSAASTSGAVSGAMTFDAATGEVFVLPPGSGQMSRARAFSTVTPFGGGFLVAGGEDPTVTFDSGRRNLRDSAELYDPEALAFDDAIIPLANPRSRHRAVVLPNGDTALIGGVTEATTGERAVLGKCEIVHVDTRTSSDGPQLAEARIDPTVLKLSDGRFFVAGGETLDGDLVASVEWRNAELQEDSVRDFEPRFDQAFVAMPGAAVLAVGGCEDRADSEETCAVCRRGCPPEDGWDAFFIDQESNYVRFTVDVPVPHPLLIAADDGSPVLVTENDDGDATLLRFDPWARTFRAVDAGDAPLPDPDRPFVSLDSGAYVYVADQGDRALLWGRRFSTRNVFSHDTELVRLTHTSNASWPLHLAPGAALDSITGLVPGESATSPWVLKLARGSVWLTDTSYADFELELELAPGGTPRLRVAGRTCSWPDHDTSTGRTLSAVRRGDVTTLSIDEDVSSCQVGRGRVSLGLSAPAARETEPARLTRLSVARGLP